MHSYLQNNISSYKHNAISHNKEMMLAYKEHCKQEQDLLKDIEKKLHNVMVHALHITDLPNNDCIEAYIKQSGTFSLHHIIQDTIKLCYLAHQREDDILIQCIQHSSSTPSLFSFFDQELPETSMPVFDIDSLQEKRAYGIQHLRGKERIEHEQSIIQDIQSYFASVDRKQWFALYAQLFMSVYHRNPSELLSLFIDFGKSHHHIHDPWFHATKTLAYCLQAEQAYACRFQDKGMSLRDHYFTLAHELGMAVSRPIQEEDDSFY